VVTTHVWSTDDPGVAGECRYPVGKARNSTWCHIKKKGSVFILTFILWRNCAVSTPDILAIVRWESTVTLQKLSQITVFVNRVLQCLYIH